MLHVNVPPELQHYGEIGDVTGCVYFTRRRVVAAVPGLRRTDEVENLRVFTIPSQPRRISTYLR